LEDIGKDAHVVSICLANEITYCLQIIHCPASHIHLASPSDITYRSVSVVA
jgi:hypothetical protein